jgi:hypothetical protein
MMETVSISETLANFYQITRRYNPEDSQPISCNKKKTASFRFENLFGAFAVAMVTSVFSTGVVTSWS